MSATAAPFVAGHRTARPSDWLTPVASMPSRKAMRSTVAVREAMLSMGRLAVRRARTTRRRERPAAELAAPSAPAAAQDNRLSPPTIRCRLRRLPSCCPGRDPAPSQPRQPNRPPSSACPESEVGGISSPVPVRVRTFRTRRPRFRPNSITWRPTTPGIDENDRPTNSRNKSARPSQAAAGRIFVTLGN